MATIVTAYFQLETSKASHNKYLQWMCNMLIIDNPMIIFCDNKSYDFIQFLRKDKLNITRIIVIEFVDFHSYRFNSQFVQQQKIDRELNIGHNSFLYMIWAEKPSFLKKAVVLDPFNTEYFLWVDIGCFRVPNTKFINWPNISKAPLDKVLLLSVNPFTINELSVSNFNELPNFQFTNRISGTIFGGGKKVLLQWNEKYYDMVEKFISLGRFIGKDQSIMNSVYLLNRDICELINWKQPCDDIWFYMQDYLS